MTNHHARRRMRNFPAMRGPMARCAAKGCSYPLGFARRQCTGQDHHAQPRPGIQLYASRTATRINIQAMSDNGWRMLAGPANLGRYRNEEPPLPYAMDNGAWTAFKQGTAFDGEAFARMVDRLQLAADWVVLPDIVAGGMESLELSLSWMPRLEGIACPVLLAVQDGMAPGDVRELLGPNVGIFIGGSTKWKVSTIPLWGALAKEVGCHIHCGRVNSARRIQLCRQHGIHSCDGTSATIYSVNAPRLAVAADDAIPLSLF